ncbi:kinase-like domain-containing protein [Trichoderma barbatum]
MKIHEKSDIFLYDDEEGDFIFNHIKCILKSETEEEYFYAKVYERDGLDAGLDTTKLDLTPIPPEDIWPQFDKSFTLAPVPLPEDCYVKRASLLDYEASTRGDGIPKLILQEAEICEILRKNPHHNIANYLGCLVVDGKIHGLCFDRYAMTLDEQKENGTPLDATLCLQDIKDGILHLHSLGLIHNDINPRNIMMNADGKPVIIDFDSCKREGEKLVKCGTPDWMIEDAQYATRDNDFFGLSRLQEFLSDGDGV